MNEDIKEALHAMLYCIDRIEQRLAAFPTSVEHFSENLDTLDVVKWNIVVIGEAVSRIRTRDKLFPLANMNAIIGTRNRIVHAYDDVDLGILWSIIADHLPQLKTDVEKVLNEQNVE